MADILKARENLTFKYKSNLKHENKIVNSENEILAYLLSRMPATFAVTNNVFSRADLSSCESILDLGSGPGTVGFAAIENIDNLKKMTFVELERNFIEKIKLLSAFSDNDILKNSDKFQRDILNINDIANHDLVTISYVLNELSSKKQDELINKIWQKADKFIVIIETGTPEGYKNIIKARTKLIELGGFVIAPCPHNNQCPLVGNDWCHFSQRIERTSYQKYLKEGSESFEDEKFSYIIVAKEFLDQSSNSRIIRHPQIHKGHLDLELCTNDGIKNTTFSKKDADYKAVKKLSWGDSLNFLSSKKN